MWRLPAKEDWISEAIANKKAKMASPFEPLVPQEANCGISMVSGSVGNKKEAPERPALSEISSDIDRALSSEVTELNRTYASIDWTLDSATSTQEAPVHLKPFASVIPSQWNWENREPSVEAMRSAESYLSQAPFVGYHPPEVKPEEVLEDDDSENDLLQTLNESLTRIELIEQPLTGGASLSRVVPLQSYGLSAATRKKAATKTWSLEAQEPHSEPVAKPVPAFARPVKPTHSVFAKREVDHEVTTLQLEHETLSPQDSLVEPVEQVRQFEHAEFLDRSALPTNLLTARPIKSLPVFQHSQYDSNESTLELPRQEPPKSERSETKDAVDEITRLRAERDEAVKKAQLLTDRLAKFERDMRKPIASILVMAKLLKALGLKGTQQKVAERIFRAANSISTDLYGTVKSNLNKTSKDDKVAPLPSKSEFKASA
jgi:hypothetical protein